MSYLEAQSSSSLESSTEHKVNGHIKPQIGIMASFAVRLILPYLELAIRRQLELIVPIYTDTGTFVLNEHA